MQEVAKYNPMQRFATEWQANTVTMQENDATWYDRQTVYDPDGSYVSALILLL